MGPDGQPDRFQRIDKSSVPRQILGVFAREAPGTRIVISSPVIIDSCLLIELSAGILQRVAKRTRRVAEIAERIVCVRVRDRASRTRQRRNRANPVRFVVVRHVAPQFRQRLID